MGTHPIFESDFDCLTDKKSKSAEMAKVPQKSKEAKAKAASGGGKKSKKKWSKGKSRDKLQNMCLFDKPTYDRVLKEVPNYKVITPSIVSDLAIIIGTLLKIDAQSRTFAGLDAFQNSCAFLGVGCLLLYCGILRYLGYFQGYNILVLTISTALPNVLKFLSCALTLYCGYALCGWLVLGPFNDKFRTLTVTSETLFSLLNGDDMFNTFQILEPRGPLLFSQVYLYSFICVFIYVVLSLFISVVMDSYDTIKANNGMRNHPPGVKAALTDAVADAQSGRYDRPGADTSTCNPCFFLLPRRRFNSTSTSADQSLLGETEINLGEPGDTTQVQSSNSTLSTRPY